MLGLRSERAKKQRHDFTMHDLTLVYSFSFLGSLGLCLVSQRSVFRESTNTGLIFGRSNVRHGRVYIHMNMISGKPLKNKVELHNLL